jgi:hypothetical protein
MATSPPEAFRMSSLQRLTAKPIENAAEQAAVDQRLKRGEQAVSGGEFPVAQAAAGNSGAMLARTKDGSARRSSPSQRQRANAGAEQGRKWTGAKRPISTERSRVQKLLGHCTQLLRNKASRKCGLQRFHASVRHPCPLEIEHPKLLECSQFFYATILHLDSDEV